MEKTYDESMAGSIAQELLHAVTSSEHGAVVLALQGELGAGKTRLTQEIGKLLGVSEQIVSPTFVLMKRYQTRDPHFHSLVHIDAYRIEDERELLQLRFEELLKEPRTLLIVEWPERIPHALPEQTKQFKITHAGLKRIIEEIKHA